MFTEEFTWLKGRDLARVMGGAVVDWARLEARRRCLIATEMAGPREAFMSPTLLE